MNDTSAISNNFDNSMKKHVSKGTYQNNNSHLAVIEDEYADDNYRKIRTQSDEDMHTALVNSIDQTDA